MTPLATRTIHRSSPAAAAVEARAEERENIAVTYAALGFLAAIAAIVYGLIRGTPPPLVMLSSALLLLSGVLAAAAELREARRLRRHARTLARYARRAR